MSTRAGDRIAEKMTVPGTPTVVRPMITLLRWDRLNGPRKQPDRERGANAHDDDPKHPLVDPRRSP